MRIRDWSSDVCSSDLIQFDFCNLDHIAAEWGWEQGVGTSRLLRTRVQDVNILVRGLPQRVDAALGDGPGDDALLELLGALADVHDLGVPVHALDVVLAGVAVTAEDLDRPLGDPRGDTAGLALGLAALGVLAATAVARQPRGPTDKRS